MRDGRPARGTDRRRPTTRAGRGATTRSAVGDRARAGGARRYRRTRCRRRPPATAIRRVGGRLRATALEQKRRRQRRAHGQRPRAARGTFRDGGGDDGGDDGGGADAVASVPAAGRWSRRIVARGGRRGQAAGRRRARYPRWKRDRGEGECALEPSYVRACELVRSERAHGASTRRACGGARSRRRRDVARGGSTPARRRRAPSQAEGRLRQWQEPGRMCWGARVTTANGRQRPLLLWRA